ncbi:MAG: NUDIX hydrolase [Candidatus Levyibacteriota bacterium]
MRIKIVFFSVMNDVLCIFLEKQELPFMVLANAISLGDSLSLLSKKTVGISAKEYYAEQLYSVTREKNIIDVVYVMLLPEIICTKKQMPLWKTIDTAIKTSPDRETISYALQRLRWKIEYTNVVYSLLPEEFTLSDLQKLYEAILGKSLDKRNFRKKMLSLQFLRPTNKKRIQSARPATLYVFKKREPTFIKVFS